MITTGSLSYVKSVNSAFHAAPALRALEAPRLAINSADDFVNPPELGAIDQLIKRVKRGKFVLIPISDQTRGHGTHTFPAVWGKYLSDFLAGVAPH